MSTNIELTPISDFINMHMYSNVGSNRHYYTNNPIDKEGKFVYTGHGKEVPVYALSYPRRIYSADGISGYVPEIKPVKYSEYAEFRSLGGPFQGAFKEARELVNIEVKDESTYHVCKGTILDEDLNALILTTYVMDNTDVNNRPYDIEFDKSRLRIYVNRKVFTDEFKDSNRKMYNFIRNKAMPIISKVDVPVYFKTNLEIVQDIRMPNFKTIGEYKNLVQDNAEEIKSDLAKYLQSTVSH